MILPIVLVTIDGANPDIQRDIENANLVWAGEMEVWVDVISSSVVDQPNLLVLDQTDCRGINHVVSEEEDQLFNLGRGLGSDLVGYYIGSSPPGAKGCAAHPPTRRGFWVGDTATGWTFIHEATHVVGNNRHVFDTDNLMLGSTSLITNLPPDLNAEQKARILDDPALLCISSIVLNL